MAVYRRTTRPRFTLLLLALSAITLITLDFRGGSGGAIDSAKGFARDAFAPVQSATGAITSPIGNFFQGVFHYGDLEEENARLRQQLEDAEGTRARAAGSEREHKALLDLEDLPFVGDIPTVSARVLSTSWNFDLTVQLSKGRNAGIAKGMPVITGAGLVGRVVEVSRSRSTVLLITDPTSSVGVRLTDSQDVGVATGKGQGKHLGVNFIGAASPVDRGEIVVTSGLQQSIFPPDVPVGKVVVAVSKPGALEKRVTIAPLVDLRRLNYVKVLQWSPKA